MSTILVTGAGGGLGSNVVRTRSRADIRRARVRDPKKVQLPEGSVALTGDALDAAEAVKSSATCRTW